MSERFNNKIDQWVKDIMASSKNLATEIELKEQAKVALNLFMQSDIDGSETLSFNELKTLCDMAGLPMEVDEEEALIKMDKDDSGSLDIEEWTTWWLTRVSALPNPIKQQEAVARNTFVKFDADGSGCLDTAELSKLISTLGADFTADELEEALTEIDTDFSGVIEMSEFIAWWTNRAAANRSNTSLISLKMRKLAQKASQVFSTDIFVASWNGEIELVKAFLIGEPRLALAADTSEYGEGWTALHYACYQGHVQVVEALLAGRCEVNRTNDLGFSALFYAAQRGHIAICSLLLDKGADPSITGAYQPQPLLGSDGPPQLGAPEPEAALTMPSELFMCPVEHIIDYPELKALFESCSKCAAPQAPDYDQVSALLSLSTGLLALELHQQQKQISHLPVKRWEAKLTMDHKMDTDLVAAEVYTAFVASGLSITCSVPAVHPKRNHSYSAPLDKAWVKKLHFLCAIHKMKRLQLVEVSPLGLKEVFVEFCAIYGALDPQHRAAINVVDFMYLIIKKCTDRTHTKDLRRDLRTCLEQVRINGNSWKPGNQPDAETGKTGFKKKADSKEQGATGGKLDLNDPIVLVHAAISELLSRKASSVRGTALDKEKEQQQAAIVAPAEHEVESKSKEGGERSVAPGPAIASKPKSKAVPTLAPDSSAGRGRAEAPVSVASTVRWVLAEGPEVKAGAPTVSLRITAVNSWGAGPASSTVPVAIHFGKASKTATRS